MAKDTRAVLRGIGITEDGKYRVETDPDRIAGMYSQAELDALVSEGVLSADNAAEWKSTKAEESAGAQAKEPEAAKDESRKADKSK